MFVQKTGVILEGGHFVPRVIVKNSLEGCTMKAYKP